MKELQAALYINSFKFRMLIDKKVTCAGYLFFILQGYLQAGHDDPFRPVP